MLDKILTIALLFSKQEVIIPVTILGFYFVHPQAFVRSLIALLGGMVAVAYLKSQFLVPLKPHLGVGYAFPSGHMFMATVYWTTLSFELRHKLLSLLSAVLLALIAIALIHFNYHDSVDVIAGIGFGLLFVIIHILIHRLLDLNESAYALFMLAACLILAYVMSVLPSHLYLSFGALGGVTLASLIFKNIPSKLWQQILGLVICFLIALIALKGIPYLVGKGTHLLTIIQYALLGSSLRLSAHVSAKV